MDAMASEVQRRGDAFMSKWAEIMTNMQPKTYFFRPDVAAQVRIQGVTSAASMQADCADA
jgi:hypothetical protein